LKNKFAIALAIAKKSRGKLAFNLFGLIPRGFIAVSSSSTPRSLVAKKLYKSKSLKQFLFEN